MKEYKLFGANTKLSPTAQLIMEQNIKGLEKTLGKEWELNQKIDICEYVEEYPINLALIENKLEVVDYFLREECELNHVDSPAIVSAVRNCTEDTIVKLLEQQSQIDLTDNVGKNAYSAALYSDRYKLLGLLLKSGLSIDNDKGKSFRQAVYNRQLEAVHFFLNNGIDPNIRTPDMVMPYNPTAVAVAASNDDFELVKTLVSRGADITLSDTYGDRPYLIAIKNKNWEMAQFFKDLEPTQWHEEEGYATKLRTYNMPEAMIAFLRSNKRKLDITSSGCSSIEFNFITNTREVTWKKRKFIDLLIAVDNYWEEGFLVWLKKERKLAFMDYEHEEVHLLCTWPQFIKDPSRWISKIVDYEF